MEPLPKDEPPPTQSIMQIIMSDLTIALGALTPLQVANLQAFIFGGIGEALRPVIRQEIQDAFAAYKDTAEIGKQNAQLQVDFERDIHRDI